VLKVLAAGLDWLFVYMLLALETLLSRTHTSQYTSSFIFRQNENWVELGGSVCGFDAREGT